MSDIALVSANFGGIDSIEPVPRLAGVDTFYYTDEATRARTPAKDLQTWTQVLVPDYPRYDFSPRLRAKYFKLQIHRLEEVRRYRWLVWIDSSINMGELDFLLQLRDSLSSQPPGDRVVLVPHPHRRTVREEYEYITREMVTGNRYLKDRYEFEKLPEQIADFRRRNWNIDAQLYCGGFWMIENSEHFHRVWDDWWDQNLRYGLMDQLPLGVLLMHHHCTVQQLKVNIYENQYWGIRWHKN
jgi:hypothetical protein